MLDFARSIFLSVRLIRQYHIKAIYSEGWPGALMGYYLSKLTGCRHMIHTFEPHADYMVEAGVWRESSWETKLLRWHEKIVARHAAYIFTATRFFIQKLMDEGVHENVLYRVPSCVDHDHFKFLPKERNVIREKYGIAPNEQVLIYLGKFGGMYMEEEAFEFFQLCQAKMGAWIIIASQDDASHIASLCKAHQLHKIRTIITSLTRDQVPSYLSAADMGFVAVRQWPSKKYCSPIKTGEYLACGLPVIVPAGVSDDPDMLQEKGIGIVMKDLKKNTFLEVINAWQKRINTIDPAETRHATRHYTLSDRSVQHYQKLYARLFETI